MYDFNTTNDPALIKRDDVVKRLGPNRVDYAYQAVIPLKRSAPQQRKLNPTDLRKALYQVGQRAKSS